MKKLVVIFTLLLTITVLVIGCTGEPKVKVKTKVEKLKVGVIDQDRVWTESKKAQKYQKDLNQEIEAIQKRYKEELANLDKEEKVKKHQEVYQEINGLRKKMRDKFKGEIENVVEEIAKEKQLDAVLNKQDVRYGGIDLTDQVIQNLK